MAIDRCDDVDLPGAPARPDAGPSHETPADADPGDYRQQQLAEHVRNRDAVNVAYQAAGREAWAKAVPELRGAWEEHKQKYPERTEQTPQTQPDGSWVAGGHRRLTPEQNAEASRCSADLRDEAERVILPAMKRVEAADPERRLAGLEHMLKGEDRLKEKIADYMRAPGVTIKDALEMVPDAVRFTLTSSSERYTDSVLSDVGHLKSEGFELVKLKNLWHADQYKGVNSQWRNPDTGTHFEMQFHTPESLEAKELTHEAYERIRVQTSESHEQHGLEEYQRRVNTLIFTPPDVDRIKNYPETHDG